ncbi:hypothetical protein [Roseibacillus persicicus]|uniref:Ferrichrome ABC transporter permease n=1 Tax=Roseibacillus persicicus TaxID=454148 RepID=A0A918TJH6_9BACT|nr:hypothetical protein [Roseibacillus persicicus]GHC50477.1 hypothetical protein GCM10007100_15760 [Roseibacillus persicicus]
MLPTLVIFLSAFLLFMVQLLMGKLLLPWFGGSPAVWTTCMLFFQVLLLGGYSYAHGLSKLSGKSQGRIHGSLLALAVLLLGMAWSRWGSPLIPDDSWLPENSQAPQKQILLLLLVSIGLPFFLLSSTSPLIQYWQGQEMEESKTWRLYAISNIGSLLGLLSYPFLVERFLSVQTQAIAWAIAFTFFALGVIALARKPRAAPQPALTAIETPDSPPTVLTLASWLLLPMTTSAMLLAVTNELCQEVAAVPFLWMLPLTLYLLSFIICFDRPAWYHRRFFLFAGAIATVAVLITASLGIRIKIPIHAASFGLFLFLFCMIGHGELVRLRPATSRLTLFYLMVSLGGALGGLFISLLAPLLFNNFWEFNIIATIAWALLGILLLREKDSLFHRGDWWQLVFLLAFIFYFVIRLGSELYRNGDHGFPRNPLLHAVLALLFAWAIGFALRQTRFAQSKYWPRLSVVLVIFVAECFLMWRVRDDQKGTLVAERNFYGALKVSIEPAISNALPARVQLTHGNINHGFQYLDQELAQLPVSYYGEDSGVELAIQRHPRRLSHPPRPLRIGVLGLGAGTVAAYGEKGDLVRFYEINPAVVNYSLGEEPYFSYLANSPATTEIQEGDARLTLARELAAGEPGRFDVLVLDAFSSDSVPAHLLTREAFELYQNCLRDEESVIAINISNRFLDFRDLIGSQSELLGYFPLIVQVRELSITKTPSSWIILSKHYPFLQDEVVIERAFPNIPQHEVIWTDNFSNLFQILRW